MGAALGRESDPVDFLTALAASPHRHDFYQTLRRLECLYAGKPRWGRALRPVDEPIRLGQDPDLSFAPAPLASLEPGSDGRSARLLVRLFGLLGPNGPLPLHLTEYARERLRHAGDPTLARFLDVFNHRFLALFYRAWAQAQPHVSRDRPAEDRYGAYVASFFGLLPAACRRRDTVPDEAKFFHVGALIRQVRNPAGLVAILQHFFRVPVQMQQFVGRWLVLGRDERSFVARSGARLGSEAVLGGRVWDRQSTFRLRMGPLTLAEYESFLPGGTMLRKLVDWVRVYLCFELDWDVRLVLMKDEVPPLRLSTGPRLGWTTWLGTRRSASDAEDLCLDAESLVERVTAR